MFKTNLIMTEKKHLPPNLHEKMEYVISQIIVELHDTGRSIQEPYDSLPDDTTDDATHDAIDNLCNLSYVNLFNEISNNYFNEEDKNELHRYYRDDWNVWTRMSITYNQNIHIYMIGIHFARENLSIIKNILDSLNTSKPLLK